MMPAIPNVALDVTCPRCHAMPGYVCHTPGGVPLTIPHASRTEVVNRTAPTTRWAEVTAAIPMSTRCAACGQPFGTHAGLDCRVDGADFQSTFSPSIFVDHRTPGMSPPEQRNPDETQRMQRVIRGYVASLEPVPSLVPCTATPPGYASGSHVCCRLGSHGTHVYVYGDGSAWTWAPGDTDVQSHAVGTFSRIGERLVPEDEEPANALCPCGDGCDADDCPACRTAELECTYCDGIGHEADDCPVREEDEGPEDDYFESDGCTCKNCIAAAEYTGPVE